MTGPMNYTPNPFELSQQIAANIHAPFQDKMNALDRILSEASKGGDQYPIEQALAQVMRKVSPANRERAAAVLAARQERVKTEKERQDKLYGPQLARQRVLGGQQPSGQRQQLEQPEPQQQRPVDPSDMTTWPDEAVKQALNEPTLTKEATAELKDRDSRYKEDRADARERRKERGKVIEEIMDRANAAREGIANRQDMLRLINTGNLNDPTFYAVANALPWNLGERFLSPETVQYRASLIDEYKDLRRIFQGQTRVKEIQLLEQKVADLYLTDDQKAAILISRMKALQYDILREQIAEELEGEYPDAGALQFNRMVQERLANDPEAKRIVDEFLDEQWAILGINPETGTQEIDPSTPHGQQILQQIKREAGDDSDKALKLAQDKGYIIKGM